MNARTKDRPSLHQLRGRGLSKTATHRLEKLISLLRRQDHNAWAIGDCCIPLVDSHRVSLRTLSEITGHSRSRLCEYRLTAKVFGPAQRQGFTFQDSLLARLIQQRLKTLDMSLLQIRDEIKRLSIKRLPDAKRHFVQRLLWQERNEALAHSAALGAQHGQVVNAVHHADYREVIPQLPDSSAKLIIADPPFGGYSWRSHGGYASGRSHTSGLRYDCDNNTTEEALAVTLDLFDICLPKLAEGGCLVLFQPGGQPDRPEVLTRAKEPGWSCRHTLTWHKSNMVNPCGCAEPYGISTERILVFSRRNEELRWHEKGLPRSDVLTFDAPTKTAHQEMEQGKRPFGDMFVYQKPIPMMELLIRKHTHPGELVVEPFGGSGSAVIAAAQLDRRWLYCESNQETFVWAARRIDQALKSVATAAS